jgi:hypothetical protein
MSLSKTEITQREETIDEFLAHGGRIERIEDHPDPDGRVLRRGHRERQGKFNPFSLTAAPVIGVGAS